jgi:hypothetical protein
MPLPPKIYLGVLLCIAVVKAAMIMGFFLWHLWPLACVLAISFMTYVFTSHGPKPRCRT